MNQERFLAPRLVGARFAQHSLPLEILKDFAVFEKRPMAIARARLQPTGHYGWRFAW